MSDSTPSANGARFFDPKFRANWRRYIAQCLAATLVILLVLIALDSVRQTVLIASLAASSFIAFAMPHTRRAGPRYLIGGYLVGTVVGCAMSVVAGWLSNIGAGSLHLDQIVCGALATGVAILCMVTTDTEHPPAAALALGFVLNEWDALTLLVVLGGIMTIAAIKEATRPLLIDLL